MLERTFDKINIKPLAFPFRVSASSNDFVPSSSWSSSTRDTYLLDYVPGPPPQCPEVRPASPARNRPQAKYVRTLRRIYDQPVCTVLPSVEDEVNKPHFAAEKSITKTSYPEKQAERRHLCFPKLNRADHCILPMLPDLITTSEAIIPARTKFNPTTTTLSTGSPYKYLTRKRRGFPAPQDKGVFYGQACLPNCHYEVPDHESISSLCGLPFSRRRTLPVPTGKLVVEDFDGGAPAPVEISHQFQARYTDLLRSNTIS